MRNRIEDTRLLGSGDYLLGGDGFSEELGQLSASGNKGVDMPPYLGRYKLSKATGISPLELKSYEADEIYDLILALFSDLEGTKVQQVRQKTQAKMGTNQYKHAKRNR